MKWLWLAATILCLCQIGCKENGSSPPPQQTQQTDKPDDVERTTCEKQQTHRDDCGEYKVLSYDATWENGLGNQGAFVLERDGLTIHAHCGSENCWKWSESVGKTVIADRGITDLITRYEPLCEDPLFVKNARERHKKITGKDATVGDVCNQTLIVEKIEVKPMPKD